MLFSKQNIFDKDLSVIASLITVHTAHHEMNTEQKQLLLEFIITVQSEVDKKECPQYKMVIDYDYAFIAADLPKDIANMLVYDMTNAPCPKKHNALSLTLTFPTEIELLPEKLKFIFIHQSNLGRFKKVLKQYNKDYQVVVTHVPNYLALKSLKCRGAEYYTGEFLESPEDINHSDVPVSKSSLVNLINTLNETDVELDKISEIILADNLLSYKLLLVINSPIFRGMKQISSIQEAIVRFGYANLKKWGVVLSLSSFSNKPPALIRLTLQRAILCEKLAESLGYIKTESFYTAGLFSTLDAFLDTPIEKIIKQTSLSLDVANAVLHHQGKIGAVLKQVIAYQRGDCRDENSLLTKLFIKGVHETNEIFNVLQVA